MTSTLPPRVQDRASQAGLPPTGGEARSLRGPARRREDKRKEERRLAEIRRARALADLLAPALQALHGLDRPGAPQQMHSWIAGTVLERPELADQLCATYAERVEETPAAAPPRNLGRARRGFAWFTTHVWNAPGVVFVMATGVAGASYVLFAEHPAWRMPVLSAFLVLLPTLLPGFLYLRFITFRIGPLCEEYVYNLHRLGVDAPQNLPEPSQASEAWTRWREAGGQVVNGKRNIYRAKFESQYGRWPASEHEVHKESLGQLMSVYLCLVVLGVGWAGVVWTVPLGSDLPRLADALRFGFLGAYFFLLSLLVRRYFQNDLRPGAYLSGVVRIVTVLVLVVAVDQAFAMQDEVRDRPYAGLNVMAFVVGVFPSVGMQFLRRAVGKLTGVFRGGLEPPFPLSQLDGMDIWSEARLLEVGIEDVQHLATANLVDVCLGARIPTQRVVDWVDQAMLLLRTGLPRTDNLRQPTTYAELRGLTVRSSTDLIELVEDLRLDLTPGGAWPSSDSPVGCLMTVPPAAVRPSGKRGEVPPSTVPLLTRLALAATTLRHEPNLPLVQHWHETAPDSPGGRCDEAEQQDEPRTVVDLDAAADTGPAEGPPPAAPTPAPRSGPGDRGGQQAGP